MLAISIYTFGQNKSVVLNGTAPEKKTSINVDKTTTTANADKAVGDVIWSDDFSDAGKWSITTTAGDGQDWVITNVSSTTVGYGRGTWVDASNVVTNENGYGLYDSDAWCGGSQDAFLSYTTPIDLSAYPKVAVRFAQRITLWQTTVTNIQFSIDGGANWLTVEANAGRPTSTTYEEFAEYNVSSLVGGQSSVLVRFNYVGDCDYAWMVDDVSFIVSASNEMVLEDKFIGFFGIGYYSNIPSTLVTDLTMFYGIAFNNGTDSQTDIQLNTVISDNVGEVLNSTGSAISYASYTPGMRDTVYTDTTGTFRFTTPSTITGYDVDLTLSQTQVDENLGNNVANLHFNVTDTVFSRDYVMNSYTGPSRYPTITDGDYFGVLYYFPVQQEVNSISVFIRSFSNVGATLIGKIYADDGTGNLIEMLASDPYTVDSAGLGAWVNLPFVKDGSSEFMAADMVLYAVVESYGVVDGVSDVYYGADNSTFQSFEDGTIQNYGGTLYFLSNMPMIRLNVMSSLTVLTAYIDSKTNVSCNGAADGTATAAATSGVAPFTYLWDANAGNQTTATATGLAAGTYTVTVTDATFSEATTTVSISQPTVLSATDVPTWNSIDLTVTGGTPAYTYLWSNGAVTQDIENLAPGSYTVTITDVNGCTTTLTEVITNIVNADSKSITVYPNPTNSVINISNAENSQITVYNILGESVVSISNNKSIAKIDISNLAEGTYVVKIVSNNNATTKKIYLVK